MKQPQITVIFNRRKTATTQRKSAVEIRITYNYKQKYISTGILLYINQWKNNQIINTPDALQLNHTLELLVSNVRDVLLEMIKEGNINIFDIPSRLSNNPISFVDFCKKKLSIKKYGKTKLRCKRYDYFFNIFNEWGRMKYFNQISEENIILFDKYLKERHLKPYTIWHNYHMFLKPLIQEAVKENYIKSNPYDTIKLNKGNSKGDIEKALTQEEFDILKTIHMPTDKLVRVRDTFVFQTYTCLSYSDLKQFNPDNIITIDNIKVYTGTRLKTNIPYTIPLIKEAIAILEKYNNKLPIISNVKYNEYLKVVASVAAIDKPISSHWARHTGATMLLNQGISMNIISRICGHSSTRITESVYAKLIDDTVVEAFKTIL